MTLQKGDFDLEKYHQLLADFGVKNENELSQKLDKESLTLPCQFCGTEVSINIVRFIDGDPCCQKHYEQYRGN
jgi:hypothetical protein